MVAASLKVSATWAFYLDRLGLPVAVNATSEAVEARRRWFALPQSTLFLHVHIHKCGGMTLEQLLPRVIFGENRTARRCPKTWSFGAGKKPTCLMRQIDVRTDVGVDKVREAFAGEPPSYASSNDELGAYDLLPWQADTIKFTFVRDPWDRMMSDMKYNCRRHGNPNVLYHVRDAAGNVPRKAVLFENTIESHLLPKRDWHDDRSSNETMRGAKIYAARRRIASFGFIGVVEEFDASLCLFARSFVGGTGVTHSVICDFCCADRTLERRNVADDDPKCAFDFDDDDRARFAASHIGDYDAYDIATDIFRHRLALAVDEDWGGDPEIDCGCSLHRDHQKRREEGGAT
ncbi:hypothetical protein CTAYLR_009315 [Chrysophaeum taylorii]|uniref:Sulfotransferase n=1 Tax=Chrysophaeum taylorii TaxID=2483200 RepID=A0AAD7UIV0_9STRA|nr:hypothetical protein CTAYLR_009315 [Chrysophaeum taylorii]